MLHTYPNHTPTERTAERAEQSDGRLAAIEAKGRVCPADDPDPAAMEHYYIAGQLGRLAAELIDWQRYLKNRANGEAIHRADREQVKALCGTFAKRLGGWIAEVLAAQDRHERWREIRQQLEKEAG